MNIKYSGIPISGIQTFTTQTRWNKNNIFLFKGSWVVILFDLMDWLIFWTVNTSYYETFN